MTNTVGGFDSRLSTAEEIICELEYIQTKIVQKWKIWGEKTKEQEWVVGPSSA